MFGIDVHPVYQLLLSFVQAKREGYDAVFVKVSEGGLYIPKGLRRFVRRIKKAGFPVIGYYHFLTSSDGDRQAANFCKQVNKLGGPDGKVLIVDFESNAVARRVPSNRDLKKFVRGVKRRFPRCKILLYSGYGFWTGGESSGDASEYDVDALWDARYADLNKHENPKAYWNNVKGWWLGQPRWGGKPPPKRIAGQFTSTGKVAGKYIDVNVFFVTIRELKEFATRDKRG